MSSRGGGWWLGVHSGGRRGGREPPRHRAANPDHAAFVRSEGAKKRSALKWVNRDLSSPPSLRDYAPAWWIQGREARRFARAANGGEGGSRGPAPPCAAAPPRAPVVAEADYAADSDEERAAIDMLTRESELAVAAELELERAEMRRNIALVRAREAMDRAAGASSSAGPVVKAEHGDE